MVVDFNYYSGYLKAAQGSATKATGDMLGLKSWSDAGAKTHAEGTTEMKEAEARARLQDAQVKSQKARNQATAVVEEANGYLTSLRGAILGDKKLNSEGLAAQRAAEAKLKKNAI